MTRENREELDSEELEWQRRRKERAARMRLEKEKQIKRQQMFKLMLPVAAIILVVGIVGSVWALNSRDQEKAKDIEKAENAKQSQVSGSDEQVASKNPDDTEESVVLESMQQNESEDAPESEVSTEWESAETVEEVPQQAVSADNVTAAPPIATASNGQYEAHTTNNTVAPPEEVVSSNVVFIDLESGEVLAQRGYKEVVSPASMTKVLTVLVAAEHVTDLDDTFTMTIDITDYSYSNDCSSVGFEVGEVVTVRDLFYGTILPSGGDAAVGLATYVAGSHEAFVELMNEKLKALGLSDTAHFTNCVGLYDEEHHCSVYDMAMIMEAALENELCREILGARTYVTSATPQHPEGITISNWFIRRVEDKDTGGKVLGAKTGYVNESGSCAVSYGVDASGKGYVCATTGANSSWRCIYDHVALYKKYAEE